MDLVSEQVAEMDATRSVHHSGELPDHTGGVPGYGCLVCPFGEGQYDGAAGMEDVFFGGVFDEVVGSGLGGGVGGGLGGPSGASSGEGVRFIDPSRLHHEPPLW